MRVAMSLIRCSRVIQSLHEIVILFSPSNARSPNIIHYKIALALAPTLSITTVILTPGDGTTKVYRLMEVEASSKQRKR